MFKRDLSEHLNGLATQYPAVAVLGPRQSGKTTLVRQTFPHYTYISLEDKRQLELATLDPVRFLNNLKDSPGIILDEFQNAPHILSDIQLAIDEKYRPGFFILTGSQNYLMNQSISQSLAGRIGILTLLPLSIHELKNNQLLPENVDQVIFYGGYPRVYDQHIPPAKWYADYIETHVERDIKQLVSVAQLSLFRKFVGLCAGRTGQPLNMASLCNDSGISFATAREWLSLLESSYIIFLLQPHYKNFGKRLIKSPKLYFYDTGLASSLLGITSVDQMAHHYLRGGLFESFIIADLMKQFYNTSQRPSVYFWRESTRKEIDCLIEKGQRLVPLEIKSGQTISKDFFRDIVYWNKISGTEPDHNYIVYGGIQDQQWPGGTVVSWRTLPETLAFLRNT